MSHAFELKEFDNKVAYEEAIVKLLDEHQIDLVCLAGYMKIVGPTLLAAYEGRIINIHPAYLPEFPGAHGIEDAWNAGVAESGVTIHWVDSGVDTGKVIKQIRVPRLAGDTLNTFETRIHETESKLYPEVLERLGVEKKVAIEEIEFDQTLGRRKMINLKFVFGSLPRQKCWMGKYLKADDEGLDNAIAPQLMRSFPEMMDGLMKTLPKILGGCVSKR